jgi:hypothetical protein
MDWCLGKYINYKKHFNAIKKSKLIILYFIIKAEKRTAAADSPH